jgi:uncharacterized protein YdhG (YjbR/CyaY superfamily)
MPSPIDAYLEPLAAEQRTVLEVLRRQIKAAAPGAEECISYQMPAFRLDGRIIAWFHAAKNHCSFFPGAGPIEACREDLEGFSTSKGTVRFTPERPLPTKLVKKLVKAKIAENEARRTATARRKRG